MRTSVNFAFALAALVAASLTFAQSSTPPSSTPSSTPSSPPQNNSEAQQRPDARYPNPSGQDSKPSTTTVKPTPTPKSSKAPQDSTTGAASSETYQNGKKRDTAPGCSTPTDAASAQGSKPSQARAGDKTVCTTSGAEGQSAKQPQTRSQTPPPKKDH
jgi:hypothetical protein